MIRACHVLAGVAAALCMAEAARAQEEAFGDSVDTPSPMTDPLPDDGGEAPDLIEPDREEPLPRPSEDFAPEVPDSAPPEDATVEIADEFGGRDDRWRGLLGAFRVGPTVQLGVPHIFNYGLDLLYDRTFGFGFSTGKATTTVVDPVELEIANWDVRARWHPRMRPFFVGLAYGQQELVGTAEETLNPKVGDVELGIRTRIQVTAATFYLTPHVGWFEMSASGMTIGAEIGAQVPVGSQTSMDVTFDGVSPGQVAAIKRTKQYSDFETKVKNAQKLVGRTILPYVTLLRLGWLF